MNKRKKLRKKKMMKRFLCGALRITDGRKLHMKRKNDAIVVKVLEEHERKGTQAYAAIHCCFLLLRKFKMIFKSKINERTSYKIRDIYYKDKNKRAKY